MSEQEVHHLTVLLLVFYVIRVPSLPLRGDLVMKQQEYDLLGWGVGVPAGSSTNNEMNLEEMRMIMGYSWT